MQNILLSRTCENRTFTNNQASNFIFYVFLELRPKWYFDYLNALFSTLNDTLIAYVRINLTWHVYVYKSQDENFLCKAEFIYEHKNNWSRNE